MGDVIRSISVRLVLAGMLLTMGNGPARAHDGNDIEAQAKTHLRMMLALFSKKATRMPRKRVFQLSEGSFDKIIERASQRHGIRKAFIRAVVKTESNFDPKAVSRKGAIGLMQVMPATALELGVDPAALFEPAVNIDTGTRYLRYLADRYSGRLDDVSAAYNAGPGRLESNRPLPAETKTYIQILKRNYRRYTQREEGTR